MHIFFEISRKFFNNSIRGNIRCGSSESSETLNGGQFYIFNSVNKAKLSFNNEKPIFKERLLCTFKVLIFFQYSSGSELHEYRYR